MVTQITKGIKISVDTEFQGTYYKDTKLLYAFEYSISIENQSSDVVQLNSRHWVILDSLNNEEVVNGEGVIGKKPVLKPWLNRPISANVWYLPLFISKYGSISKKPARKTREVSSAISTLFENLELI